ncbi:MAG: BPL-N domain-containing protein [Chloroflexi bacterium]|nr:BPL-N domain-containing protein [Chloroflexota bacterium]
MKSLLLVDSREDNWQGACRLINFLLATGAEVRWATEPFTAIAPDGAERNMPAGSCLITDTTLHAELAMPAAEARYGVDVQQLAGVDGFVGHALRRLRIALYGGGGAPFNHARIFTELGFAVEFLSPQAICAGELDDYDLLVAPGGGGLAMAGQLQPLGSEGCTRITNWVRRGGMYIGSCAGAFNAAVTPEPFSLTCPVQRDLQMVNAGIWNRGDSQWMGLQSPGIGVIECRNQQPDHPVMFGMPEHFLMTHYNGPLFDIETRELEDASAATALTSVRGRHADFTPAERFLSFSQPAADPLIDKAAKYGVPNTISGFVGLGRTVLFGSHPEFGFNLTMDDWGIPARMLANAAFWQSSQLRASRSPTVRREPGAPHAYPAGSGLARVAAACQEIGDLVEDLQSVAADEVAWLNEDHAMSVFGLVGCEIWRRGLGDFADIAARMQETLDCAETVLARAQKQIDGPALADEGIRHLRELTLAVEDALHHRWPDEWQQDFGYEGLLQMLERAQTMLRRALDNAGREFEQSDNAYQHFDSSPYQLVVGSYLAANGVVLNAWQLLRMHVLRLEEAIFVREAGASVSDALLGGEK